MPAFDWLPFSPQDIVQSRWYRQLRDYQRGWFWDLLFAMWVSSKPGYLPIGGDLWRLVGARDRGFWQDANPAVLAVFQRIQVPAVGECLTYPPLLHVIEQQLLKIHKRKRRSSESTEAPQGAPPSLSGFDVSKPKGTGARAKESYEERTRRELKRLHPEDFADDEGRVADAQR